MISSCPGLIIYDTLDCNYLFSCLARRWWGQEPWSPSLECLTHFKNMLLEECPEVRGSRMTYVEFKLYHFNSVVWGNRSLFPTLNFFICIMGWFLHCPPEGIGMRSNSLTCMKGLPAFLFVHTVLLGFSTWEVCSFFGAPLQRQVSFYGNYSWLITFI